MLVRSVEGFQYALAWLCKISLAVILPVLRIMYTTYAALFYCFFQLYWVCHNRWKVDSNLVVVLLRNLEGLQYALVGCPTYDCRLIYLVSFKNYYFIRLYFIVSFGLSGFLSSLRKSNSTAVLVRNFEGLQATRAGLCKTSVAHFSPVLRTLQFYRSFFRFIWICLGPAKSLLNSCGIVRCLEGLQSIPVSLCKIGLAHILPV